MSTMTRTPSRMTKCSSHPSDLIAENSTFIGNHTLRFTPKQLAHRQPAGRSSNCSRQRKDLGGTMTEAPLSPIVSTLTNDGPFSILTLRSDFQRRTEGAEEGSGSLMGYLVRCVRSRQLLHCQYGFRGQGESELWFRVYIAELNLGEIGKSQA